MKREKPNLKVTFAGRLEEGEIPGGPAKTACRLFEEHSKNNHAAFITYFFDGSRHSIFRKLFGYRREQVNGNDIFTVGIFRVYGLLQRINPAVIHIVTFERFVIFFFIYRLFNKVKLIYNSHGIVAFEDEELKNLPPLYKFRNKFSEKILLRYSDKVIFPSAMAIDIAEKYYRLNAQKCIILPGGVDEQFRVAGEKMSSGSALKAVLVYNSALNQSALRFISSYISKEPNSPPIEIFVISSVEPDLPATERIKIHFNPKMNNEKLAEFYKDKDIFLSLSDYDTFSLSTAEAMASGLIPVVTSSTGISRYIESGYNGFLIEYGDTSGLKECLNSISEMKPEKRIELSGKAASIYESLSWEKVYAMYEEIYREILK